MLFRSRPLPWTDDHPPPYRPGGPKGPDRRFTARVVAAGKMSSHFCVTAHGRAACDADHQERGGCCTPWPELVAICIAIPGHIVQIVLYNGITARSTMQTRHGQERFHMPATAGLFICKQAQDKQSSHFRPIKDRPAKDPRSAHSKTHFRKICNLHFRKRKRSGLHFIKGATTWCST